MTVLHLDTERGWRGGERQLLWLAEELGRQGHRSYVGARPGELLAARARQRGVPTVASNPVGDADVLAAMRLRRMLRLLEVDLIHTHTSHPHLKNPPIHKPLNPFHHPIQILKHIRIQNPQHHKPL